MRYCTKLQFICLGVENGLVVRRLQVLNDSSVNSEQKSVVVLEREKLGGQIPSSEQL